jgi:two-component system, LytTR family, sensor kinase
MRSGAPFVRRHAAPPHLFPMTRTRLRDGTRRWVLIGLSGWTAILAIGFADIGFQAVLQGRPLAESWPDVLRMSLLWAGPGAVLSVGVFFLFGRLVRSELALGPRLARYAGIGLAYWFAWILVQATLRRLGAAGGIPEASFGTLLAAAGAGMAFNGLLLFSAMAGIHAAAQNAASARRQERRGAELRRELERAHTSALSARLNPHFLFNTLHVASGLMARDPEGSRRVLADLRALLRQALDRDDRELVPLEDEIRLVEGYLRIQRARFGERLEVRFDVAPEARAALVPPLLLQPLVENAIQHGISRAPAGGCVRISAELRSGSRLHLAVEDTGEGEPGSPAAAVEQVGLGGVRARLGLIFGGAATAEFRSLPEGGFRSTVSIPDTPAALPRRAPEIPSPVAGHAS